MRNGTCQVDLKDLKKKEKNKTRLLTPSFNLSPEAKKQNLVIQI